MDIFSFFTKNSCSIEGKNSVVWTWQEFETKKAEMEKEGKQVILVDMIADPIPGSVPISNELFQNKYPDGTVFALYCHSGGTSGMMQKKLTPLFPQYTFINMKGGIGAYRLFTQFQ
ncbi:MAG TPA: hypothetical protein VJB65_02005 [Patescibacteria group bacterium]|nr:hypothetical protein [Patescibacteria group bacterium]